jgi:hypothetical protein
MLEKRTATLRSELSKLAGNTQRPNNAHQARTNILLIDLTEALEKGKDIDVVLSNLKDVLKESEGLTDYKITSVTRIIQELGELLADNPKYDDLLEVVIEITEQRTSEGEAGKVLLTRGYQKIHAGKRYDAIKLLGRAQQKLAMEEYKSEWVKAAAACGVAYEGIGLLWGARSNILMAANESFSEYFKHGTLLPQTLLFVQKLLWIELQLGRIPHVLAWMEFAALLANKLLLDEEQKKKIKDEREIQDLTLGILILKADIADLKLLDFLPSRLDEAGLINSWMALLYALGYEDYLRSEKVIPESQNSEEVRDMFFRWRNQPVNNEISDQPELLSAKKIKLYSYVLGCEVLVEVSTNLTSMYLAETILGALEAFLATSFDSEILPYRSELQIEIQTSDFLSGLPEYKEDESTGGKTIYIRHPKILKRETREERNAYRFWLQEVIIKISLQIAMISDIKTFLDRLIRNERGLGRALIFAEVDITIENLFGEKPKFFLSDWKQLASSSHFPLKRDQPWDNGLFHDNPEENIQSPIQYGEDNPPESLFGIDNLKHKDRKVISLINLPLWDKATWRATGFIFPPGATPVLVLGFEDVEPAKAIFKEWRNKIGEIDEQDLLRVSIITGVNKNKPSNYRVIISSNPNTVNWSKFHHIVSVSRINTMEPPDLNNLNIFLKAYKKAGRYILVPAQLISETVFPEPIWELRIGKWELNVRQAWEIGRHDPDVPAIMENDNPIIPKNIKSAPVLKALNRFSKSRRRKRR